MQPGPGSRVVTRRSNCSADRRRPAGSSTTGTGPSTEIASGTRFRTSSAARSMPNPSTCRGDPAPSASTPAQTSSAARRKSRTTPASVSAVSASIRCRLITLPLPTRNAIEPEGRPDGTNSAYLWKTRPLVIPKASPRTLAVAARSALGIPVQVGRGAAHADHVLVDLGRTATRISALETRASAWTSGPRKPAGEQESPCLVRSAADRPRAAAASAVPRGILGSTQRRYTTNEVRWARVSYSERAGALYSCVSQ
jgi:hypothetical protein